MKYLLLFLLTLVLFSCEEKEVYPEGFLEKDEFIEILIDVELLEATVKQKMLDKKYPKQFVPVYYKQIFDKHDVTYTRFKESFDWWENHPDKMRTINDSLTVRFNRMKEDIVLPEDEQENKKDRENKPEK